MSPTPVSPSETLCADASLVMVINDDGKLFIRPILPTQHNLRVVGGRGQKAFYVFDENYDWYWSSGESQPHSTTEFDPVHYGEWRLELLRTGCIRFLWGEGWDAIMGSWS